VRAVFGLVAIAAVLVASASAAGAHAEVSDASPAPGTGVPQAPGAVAIRFTEPLVRELSSIEVTAADGSIATTGPTLPVEGDDHAMRRRLGLLRPGVYTVRWTSVSPLDGHTLKGRYEFAVGTSAAPDTAVGDDPVSSEGWLGLVGRLAAFAGLALWAGATVLVPVLAGGAMPRRRLDRLARAGPILAAAGTLTAAVSSALVASGSVRSIGDVFISSQSGRWRLAVIAAAVLAAAWRARWRAVNGALVAVAVLADAAAGHAAASSTPVLTIVVIAVHVGALGVWLFAIAAAVIAGRALADVLRSAWRYAAAAAVFVALTGTAAAIIMLNSPGDLLAENYGRIVSLKVGALGAMAALGVTHHRLRVRGRRAGRVRISLRAEAAAALVALVLATLLVGFPDPPRQAEAAERRADPINPLAALTHRDAVSLAQPSGPFVVALTLLPPRPGNVTARVNIVGLDPGDGLRAGVVVARGDAGTTRRALQPCGTGCMEGRLRLGSGSSTFTVTATTNRQPIRAEYRIALPAADGSAALGDAMDAMERLGSARMRETLRGAEGSPPIVTDYTFDAPDAMRFDVSDGSSTIAVGARSARRDTPSAAWTVTNSPPGFHWPHRYYRAFWTPAAAVRLLGHDTVEGHDAEVIGFVRPDIAAWFRIWVDRDSGVVRRMEMRAEGHLMEDAYQSFDQPADVTLPSATSR
jgi:methionine-rich copper-binding protein CopC/putative copper export protein